MGDEKRFETKIKKFIEEQCAGWQVKFFANSYTKTGVPDILACINGYFVGIEVKAQNGRASVLQFHQCDKIRKAGGMAFIVYPSGWKQLQIILKGLKHDQFSAELPLILK